MHAHIAIHQPVLQTTLPAHEQAARRRRAAIVQLPGARHRSERPSRTPAPRPGARKTIDLNLPNLRY